LNAAATLLLVLVSGSDAPRTFNPLPLVMSARPVDPVGALAEARKLSEQLRFEESLVEYQRYLGAPDRPARERARALLEIAFIHLVLADEVNAQRRAGEALELDPLITLPPDAPQKHADFLSSIRRVRQSRAKLEVLPRADADRPEEVHARRVDPEKRTRTVLLRHSLAKSGPFHGTPMRCTDEECVGSIPPPDGGQAFTAWYFLEANDSEGNTVARAASAADPLQVSVIQRSPWYRSPYVWGGGAAILVGAAAVFFIASSGPQ
jgi:hypothetical protein